MTDIRHQPVLLDEALAALRVHQDGRYLDATAGHGGHSEAIARQLTNGGFLLALDRDQEAVEVARERLAVFGSRVRVEMSSFGRMTEQARACGIDGSFNGILMDLGVGSHQLDDPGRGFSIQHDGPLDMRYRRASGRPTAADLVNELSERELADLFFKLGDERRSRRIARAIVRRRLECPFTRTADLATVIEKAVGGRRGKRTHPATKAFQALRIETNDELGEVRKALPQAVSLLAPGGRLAILSFHSKEHRLVKLFMREQSDPCVCPPDLGTCVCERKPTLTLMQKKAVRPSAEEVNRNPRSRSAQLRVAIRTDVPTSAVRVQNR